MIDFVAPIARYQLSKGLYFIIENPQTFELWMRRHLFFCFRAVGLALRGLAQLWTALQLCLVTDVSQRSVWHGAVAARTAASGLMWARDDRRQGRATSGRLPAEAQEEASIRKRLSEELSASGRGGGVRQAARRTQTPLLCG